jgi:hypothetical protein
MIATAATIDGSQSNQPLMKNTRVRVAPSAGVNSS